MHQYSIQRQLVQLIPLKDWIRQRGLAAENTLAFIEGLESDCDELSVGLGAKVRLMIES